MARRSQDAVSGSACVGDWGCVSSKCYRFMARGGLAKVRPGTDKALEGDEYVISGFRAVVAKSPLPLSHILLPKAGIPVPGTLNSPQEGPSLLSSGPLPRFPPWRDGWGSQG